MAQFSWFTANADLTTDEILGAAAWSAVGGATRDTGTKKFGAGALKGNTSGDGVLADVDIPGFESGLSEWCISGWVQFDNGVGDTIDANFDVTDTSGLPGIQLHINTFSGFTLGLFQIRQSGGSVVAEVVGSAGGLGTRDTSWHHFEANFSGTVYRFFWDGVLKHSSTDSDRASVTSSTAHRLSWYTDPVTTDKARFDNIRFYTNVVHTTNFTPPTDETDGSFGVVAPASLPHLAGLLGNIRILTADSGSLAITGTAAGVLATRKITADSGSVVITGTAATLTETQATLSAESGSIAITGTAVNLVHSGSGTGAASSLPHLSTLLEFDSTFEIAASTGNVTITGTAATFRHNHRISIDDIRNSVDIVGSSALLSRGRIVAANAGAIGITGTAATLSVSSAGVEAPASLPHLGLLATPARTIAALSGAVTISGTAATLLLARKLTADSGSLAITGTDVVLNKGGTAELEAGSVIINGDDSASFTDHTLGALSGAVAISGSDAGLIYSQQPIVIAEIGTIALTGTDAGLLLARRLVAETGAIAVDGTDVELTATTLFSVDSGDIGLTGTEATLRWGRFIDAEVGSIELTGEDAVISPTGSATLVAESGSIGISGQDMLMLLQNGFGLIGSPVQISITGQAAALAIGKGLAVETGIIGISGQPANLILGTTVPPFWLPEQPKPTDFWVKEAELEEV